MKIHYKGRADITGTKRHINKMLSTEPFTVVTEHEILKFTGDVSGFEFSLPANLWEVLKEEEGGPRDGHN